MSYKVKLFYKIKVDKYDCVWYYNHTKSNREVIAKMKRKIDQSTVAIIIGVASILINLIFSGKDLLRNVRWLLSYLH